MKHFLYNKTPQTKQEPTNITNKNKAPAKDESQNSSNSDSGVKQNRQLHVDDVTLKERATNKQIKILVFCFLSY